MTTDYPITWTFVVNKSCHPDANIQSLLKHLSLNTMEFFTNDLFSENLNHVYKVTKVSMLGEPSYVNEKLKNTWVDFKQYFFDYIDSDESFITKRFQLRSAQFLIHDYLFKNNEDLKYLIDLKNLFVLHNSVDDPIKEVTTNFLKISEEINAEIRNHLYVRNSHLSTIDAYISLQLERLELIVHPSVIDTKESNREREENMLSVWISLKDLGYIDHLLSKNEIAEHRKLFFNLFGLVDQDYNDRHKSIKERKENRTLFLDEMVNALENHRS